MHTLSQVQSYRSVGILPIIPPGQFNDPLVALRTQILPPQFSLIGFGRRYGTVHRNHVPLLDPRRQGGGRSASADASTTTTHPHQPPPPQHPPAPPTAAHAPATNAHQQRPRIRPHHQHQRPWRPLPHHHHQPAATPSDKHPRTIRNQEHTPQYRPTTTRMDRPGSSGVSEFVGGRRVVPAPEKYSDDWTAERFSDPARLALRLGPGRRRGR